MTLYYQIVPPSFTELHHYFDRKPEAKKTPKIYYFEKGQVFEMFNYNFLISNNQNVRGEGNTRPVRDSSGRFIKGHKALIRPKYELLKKYPKLLCDTCCKRDTCPEYHHDYVCAYKREFKKFQNRNLNHVLDALSSITNNSLLEMQFAVVQEIINGGKCSSKVTRLVNKNMNRLMLLFQLHIQIENKKSIR